MNKERTLLEGLAYYLSILLKYRWLMIALTGTAAVCVIAFCAASLLLPPEKSPLPNQYTASAIILVQKGAESDLSSAIRAALESTTSSMEQAAGFDNGAFLLMVLQSRTFLDKVIEDFGIAAKYRITYHAKSRSRKKLLGNLHFDNNRLTGAITISFQDIDPVFARDLTNRIVALLGEWYAQNIGSSNQQQKQLLEEKVGEVKADIDRLQGRLDVLQKRYGAPTAQDLGTSQASALAGLRSQLILKEIDIENYSRISSGDDPKLQQMQGERQDIIDRIDRIQQGQPEMLDSSSSQKGSPDVQAEFNSLSAELDVQRKIYNTLSHQYEVVKLTSDSQPPFQVMELAEVPDVKSGPQRTTIIAEVIALAFIASIALSFLLNGVSQIRKGHKESAPPTEDV